MYLHRNHTLVNFSIARLCPVGPNHDITTVLSNDAVDLPLGSNSGRWAASYAALSLRPNIRAIDELDPSA
jgi:hypothetical protein